MTLSQTEADILKLLGELEVRHQKHTPTEVKQRFKRANPDVEKSDLDKAWTVLVSNGYIKEWTETLTISQQKAMMYRPNPRAHLFPIKTTYCQLAGKSILHLDGRSVDTENSPVMGVYDSSTPFQSVRALQSVFESAKKEIMIVDNYLGPKTLDYLMSANNVPVKIITELDKVDRSFNTALDAFKKEYKGAIEIKDGGKKFHGRFIVIDGQGFVIDHSIKQFAEKPTALISLIPEASGAYINLFKKVWSDEGDA